MIGIYRITNTVNGMVYIGQSVNIKARFDYHKTALKHGWHINRHLSNAYLKYGKDAFSFDVICECLEDELDDKEHYWIECYQATDRERGYNLDTGRGLHKHLSEETKRKIGDANRHWDKPGFQPGQRHRRVVMFEPEDK